MICSSADTHPTVTAATPYRGPTACAIWSRYDPTRPGPPCASTPGNSTPRVDPAHSRARPPTRSATRPPYWKEPAGETRKSAVKTDLPCERSTHDGSRGCMRIRLTAAASTSSPSNGSETGWSLDQAQDDESRSPDPED